MKIFFCLLMLSGALFADIEFSDFDLYQKRWTREELEEKLGLFLQKDGKVGGYFSLNEEALVLYDSPETEKERKVQYRLELAEKRKEGVKEGVKRENLVGVKVAIDPGHLGGAYARLEERYIDIPPSLERKEPIQFDEGTLSLLTAMYLKLLLEKEGAIVMLTRDQIGKGVYSESFFDWLKKNPQLWSGEVSLNKLFGKYYNSLDLRARAEKMNAFSPDLSIVIHYNSHEGIEGKSSNQCVVAQNYNMMFVPGAFCRDELSEPDSRYEFLRLLVSEDLGNSILLSKAVLKKMEEHLSVPVVVKGDGARYLNQVCLKVEEGIYARNLALTRLIRGPVCYGESLIQNNVDESLNLSRKNFVIGGIECSSRIKQVAEAYFEGIKEYLLE